MRQEIWLNPSSRVRLTSPVHLLSMRSGVQRLVSTLRAPPPLDSLVSCRPVNRNLYLTTLAATFAAIVPCFAQPPTITAADYARAEKFLSTNTMGLMSRSAVQPNWLPDGRMWYRVTTSEGS